ncbi:HU family DNA-binding protein [Pseudoalteromonas umbrosa]|uniref:HU family DNA-binding protein n=1 Tax=Pseudoalteromonas umbrosa TaxID=3048489 RepID=UPI0024C363A7|nr:HU family DNA-binding protein [Pseudoalteromonas sp. B95]MDK1290090.1 HU family DNA-binding protein [Pseudoalteromonas sp. B95]
MNKSELIAAVAEQTGITKVAAATTVNAVFDMITTELSKGSGEVKLSGFGNFTRRHKAARAGRNPQTGEAVAISARETANFAAAKALKEALNS